MPGTWTEITLASHCCRCYEPATLNQHNYTVVYLHDTQATPLAELPTILSQLEQHGLRVICPATKRSWWVDRICPEFDPALTAEQYVVKEIVPYLFETFQVKPPQIGLLGFEMGGSGALRLAYKYPNLFPVSAAIAPTVDFQTHLSNYSDPMLLQMYTDEEEARQDTATLHIHPLNWPRNQFFCAPPNAYEMFLGVDRLRMKLFSLGVPFESELTIQADTMAEYLKKLAPTAVGYLWDSFEKERRRLI